MNVAKALVLLVALSSACTPPPSNGRIYEQMWTDFDETYAGFDARGVDWNAVHADHFEQAEASTSEEELWRVFTESLDVLYDAHVYLDRGDGTGFESGTLTADPDIEFEFDEDVARSYLRDTQSLSSDNDFAFYGRVAGENLGYIGFRRFAEDGRWEEGIEQAVRALQDTDGILIDVRNNPGGNDRVVGRIAGAFTGSVELAYLKKTKNGPGRSDFDEPRSYLTKAEGPAQYTKPVVVLINSYSASAAEVFGLYMQTQSHVTFVGIPTATAFSDVSFVRFLPNGWSYTLSHQLYVYEDGTSPEGVGILPDIELRNAPDEVENGIDRVLERGIAFLR